MYYDINKIDTSKTYYMELTKRGTGEERWLIMEMKKALTEPNTKVIHTRKLTVEEHIENFNVIHNDKAMKKLACEYAKLTLTIEKYYSLIELYGCTSFDREIFVKLYEKWLDTYLTCCAKGLHKYYLTETVQDFYHTCKAELSE